MAGPSSRFRADNRHDIAFAFAGEVARSTATAYNVSTSCRNTTMRNPCFASVLLAVAAAVSVPAAHADIFTWTDKSGNVNVSNLPPPEGARVTSVTRDPPKDPAREAAAMEARRQAEVRALAERVQQLQAELERRDAPPPVAFMPPPPMPYSAPPPTYIVNVVAAPAPAYGQGDMGCGYSWGDCGFGGWPGFYAPAVIAVRGKNHHRRFGPVQGQSQIVPPLIPLSNQTRPGPRRG